MTSILKKGALSERQEEGLKVAELVMTRQEVDNFK